MHLAALQVPFVRADPPLGMNVNVAGTVNVFEAVSTRLDRIPGVAYASSAAVYGLSDPSPAPESGGTSPATLYGVSKLADEGMARVYAADAGLPSIGLRPYVVYGPGRDQGMTSGPTAAMLAAARGEPYEIGFSGTAQYDYAPDLGRAFVDGGRRCRRRGAAVYNTPGVSRLGRGGRRGDRRRRPGCRDHVERRPAARSLRSSRRSGSTATSARSRARRSMSASPPRSRTFAPRGERPAASGHTRPLPARRRRPRLAAAVRGRVPVVAGGTAGRRGGSCGARDRRDGAPPPRRDADRVGTAGGHVTYLAEVAARAARRRSARGSGDPTDDEPLRMPWARPGGPAADLAWADAVLEGAWNAAHRAEPGRSAPGTCRASGGSPSTGGAAWLKVVPPFFAHEGGVLERLDPGSRRR